MKKSKEVQCTVVKAKYCYSIFYGDCIRLVLRYDNGFVRRFTVPFYCIRCYESMLKHRAVVSFVGLFRRIEQVSISVDLFDSVFEKKKGLFSFLGGK